MEEYEIVSKTYKNEHRGLEQIASSFPTIAFDRNTEPNRTRLSSILLDLKSNSRHNLQGKGKR